MPGTLYTLPRPKDGLGRFVPKAVADLWSEHCDTCDEPKARHSLHTLACPDEVGLFFEAADPKSCMNPATDRVGCDCYWGVC
jgi:hypothetical protein